MSCAPYCSRLIFLLVFGLRAFSLPHFSLIAFPRRRSVLLLLTLHCSVPLLPTITSVSYPNLSATTPHKLAPRSTRCVFLVYSPDHKGYRCFDLSSHRLLISRHIIFDESDFPFSTISTPT